MGGPGVEPRARASGLDPAAFATQPAPGTPRAEDSSDSAGFGLRLFTAAFTMARFCHEAGRQVQCQVKVTEAEQGLYVTVWQV